MLAVFALTFDLRFGAPTDGSGQYPSAEVASIMSAVSGHMRSVNCDLLERLGFTKDVFVIQPDVPGSAAGQSEGYAQEVRASGRPGDEALYVTYPMSGKDPRIVVIVSSTAPNRLTVLTLAADRATLVYDSLTKDEFGVKQTVWPFGSVYRVRVPESGVLELDEREPPGAGRWASQILPRRARIVTTAEGTRMQLVVPKK